MRQGRVSAAEPLLKRAILILQNTHTPGDPLIARMENQLTSVNTLLGRYPEAESIGRQALTILERTPESNLLDLAIALDNLAGVKVRLKRPGEAEALYRRALDVGAVAPRQEYVAVIENNLGEFYSSQKRYTEAEPLLRRALETQLRIFGPESLLTAEILASQAALLRHAKRKGEAKKLETRIRTIRAAHARENLTGYTIDVTTMLARN